jgi:hypothetical protein
MIQKGRIPPLVEFVDGDLNAVLCNSQGTVYYLVGCLLYKARQLAASKHSNLLQSFAKDNSHEKGDGRLISFPRGVVDVQEIHQGKMIEALYLVNLNLMAAYNTREN